VLLAGSTFSSLRTSSVNFAETQATLVELGVQRLDATVNSWMFGTLQSAVPSGSPFYESVAGLNTNLATLDAAITNVRQVSRDYECVIVGLPSMVDQIRDALIGTAGGLVQSRFLPETNEELFRRGVIGKYWGANIVTLKNYTDDLGNPFFRPTSSGFWAVTLASSSFMVVHHSRVAQPRSRRMALPHPPGPSV